MKSTTRPTKTKKASAITRATWRWRWRACSMPGGARLRDAVGRIIRQYAARTLSPAAPAQARQRSSAGAGRSRSICVAKLPTARANQSAEKNTRRDAALRAELVAALRENLASGGQSMVFLNRRGYHNFLQCHLCGNVIACPNCSVSMTFHLRDRSLRCHYCGNHRRGAGHLPRMPRLGLSGQGFGTERLAERWPR